MRTYLPLSVLSTIGVPISAALAMAAFENIVTVVQPMGVEGPGIMILSTTYIGYQISTSDARSKIALTTRLNAVSSDAGTQNRNLAADEGIVFLSGTTSPTLAGEQRWPRLRGDTLDVRVDASSLKTSGGRVIKGRLIKDWETDVLEATLYCGIANVRDCEPPVRFVKYLIEGNEALASYSGLYAVNDSIGADVPLEWSSVGQLTRVGD